jgi:transposase
MLTDAHGNPLDFRITAGQVSDYTMAQALLKGRKTEVVIADKGCDSDKIRTAIKDLDAEPVIPYRSIRKNPGILDGVLYGARHAIENLFAKVKQYRSVARRCDKTTLSYCAMITLACIMTWIRLWVVSRSTRMDFCNPITKAF